MASSHGHPPPVTRPAAARPTRAALPSISSSSNGTAVGGGGGGVRRNLFQSQLTRRPTPTSSSSNSTETLRLDIDVLPETSDIVVRDKNGEFEVGDPPTPPVEEPDEGVLDEILENERMCHITWKLRDFVWVMEYRWYGAMMADQSLHIYRGKT